MVAYLQIAPSPSCAGSCRIHRPGDAASSRRPRRMFFFHSHRRRPTPKSTATARLPSAIHTSRLSEGQEGGHPVYRDRREDRDWLRGDSLMKCASAIGRPGKRGGGLSFIIQEKPGGESRIGPSGTCRQCPVSPRFTFHWWTLSTTQLWLPIISSYGLTFKMEHLC